MRQGRGSSRSCCCFQLARAALPPGMPSLATPQRLLKHTLHRVRRNSKCCKSGRPRRTHVIDLHQLHLIAGDGRIREQFCSPCQCPPSGEREWNQDTLEVGFACKGAEQLLIRVERGPPHSNVMACVCVRCRARAIASATSST